MERVTAKYEAAQTGMESGVVSGCTRNCRKEMLMALGMVQTGCRNSLYICPGKIRSETDRFYSEWLAELTTELELALESGTEDSVTDENTGEEDGQREDGSCLKEEWKEFLEQADAVDAIVRQMLEHGLGQQKEEKQSQDENQPENLDNDFDMMGIPATSEAKSKDELSNTENPGNSQFFQSNSGQGAEYWNSSNLGRRQVAEPHIFCLFCETECDRKKKWKIAE